MPWHDDGADDGQDNLNGEAKKGHVIKKKKWRW